MLNPLAFTESVIGNFLKYQLTAYPFQDERLNSQMRTLLQLDHARQSPLLRGPFVSLSQRFAAGCSVASLTEAGLLHPLLTSIAPFPHLYAHQEKAIRAIQTGQTTLVSTGTGSGKSECFLYPAISQALRLRDAHAPAGISSVIVYPMNALAEDQLDRLRGLLAGTGISFGIYVGKTPETEREIDSSTRMAAGSSKADYEQRVQQVRKAGRPSTVHPCEEVCSREKMRTDGQQPRILLTNVKQLELLLTRGVDAEMFRHATLDFLVFDEAHTFTGIIGAESACLVRRLKAFCGAAGHTVCVATSATIVDRSNPNAARDFAVRFFGVEADQVTCVTEEYQQDPWRPTGAMPPTPPDATRLLHDCLLEVEQDGPEQETSIRQLYTTLCQRSLPAPHDWRVALFDALQENPLAALIAQELQQPHSLSELVQSLSQRTEREVSESEALCYLILGAAAVRDGRAVFRPVVHAFVRGIPGAVVTFPSPSNAPQLWLSGEDEQVATEGKETYCPLRVFTCTTCGQHYFAHYVQDFDFGAKGPSGGDATLTGGSCWEKLEPERGGVRVLLVNRILYQNDDETPDTPRTAPVWFCRHCGTLHSEEQTRCLRCGSASPLVRLYAIRPNDQGRLGSCVSCQAHGGGRSHRECIREVRAVHVADVHVLAQEIIQHEDRKRLLIFADSRQDAAFQAGWMKDHARHFRLVAQLDQVLRTLSTPTSIGDIIRYLENVFDQDENLSRALLTEVWTVAPRDSAPHGHVTERRKFLMIQLTRELSLGTRCAVGLEAWGRLRVSYRDISSTTREILQMAQEFALPVDDVALCIEGILDYLRWKRIVFEPENKIYTKCFMEGDALVQQGYLNNPLSPKATKFTWESQDDKRYYLAFWKEHEGTLMSQVKKLGVADQRLKEFLQDAWTLLTEKGILVPVQLLGSKDRCLPGGGGGYQIDATAIRLIANNGFYRCDHCRRKSTRRTPGQKCLAWRCSGSLDQFVVDQPDDYNLHVIREDYALMRPEEHTAMVPQDKRDRIENAFKSSRDNQINTLVCTPTLELGVDIGTLDCTLMRNVPPLPANYWQRVGRAGRRHRMAVNLTYCRSVSYDKAYYEDPLKMLGGAVAPPAFNLQNQVLIAKHLHALILTTTNQLIHDETLPQTERDAIRNMREEMFPSQITKYLFDAQSHLRTSPFDFTPFRQVLETYKERYLSAAKAVFQASWPAEDAEAVTEPLLRKMLQETSDELNTVARRLFRRVHWAFQETQRLERLKRTTGTFDHSEDEAHYRRCDALIKKYKGLYWKKRKSQTVDDGISTYGVLAAEGFLPGYGLDTGSVRATGEIPFIAGGGTLELPRPPSMALREYVPGNLIYANGQKFVPRHYMLVTGEQYQEQPVMAFSREKEAMVELSPGTSPSAMSMDALKVIPICDVELAHQFQISDDEEYRFQMPVMVFAVDKEQHNGGEEYAWGPATLQRRSNANFRMANLGTPGATGGQCGYLICTICGQSISPLSSNEALQKFRAGHKERCGQEPQQIGFYADITADCLKMPDCENRIIAYSVMEALRMGAAHILDMHIEDLQIMVIGRLDTDAVDAYLWDPMPGGSGLIQQILARFDDILQEAIRLLDGCSGACEKACINCMQNFRNMFYHKYLDRHLALSILRERQGLLRLRHAIPPTRTTGTAQASQNGGGPVNQAEARLKNLLDRAGLTEGIWQQHVQFRKPIERIGFKTTTPDVFYPPLDDDDDQKGLCLYLDGMSQDIHGNPDAQAQDKAIRDHLRNEGYEVVELTVHDLDDQKAVTDAFKRIARFAFGRPKAKELQDNPDWFERV